MRTRVSMLTLLLCCLVARDASAQSFDIGLGYGHLSVAPCDLWSGVGGKVVMLQTTVRPRSRFSPEFLVTYRRSASAPDPQRYAYAASFSGGESTRTEIGYAVVVRQRIGPFVTK